MPFRTGAYTPAGAEPRAKVQFTTAAWMPRLIYQACLATGTPSNTAYIQTAVCEKLARDLDKDLDKMMARLPKRRTMANHLFDPDDPDPTHLAGGQPRVYQPVYEEQSGGVSNIGPANTVEEVPERHGRRF